MSEFTVRSDSVNVEQIMERIRTRIREKRGVDYTEQQIRELASVKLEKFLDPRAVRSDLLQQFQRTHAAQAGASNITFGPNAIFEAQRPIVAKIRRLLHPVLRLFFNPDPISQALLRLNDLDPRADMYYELFHNLVIELTRTGIEVKNLRMQIESLAGRLEFNERRARALESVVAYRPGSEEQGSLGSQGSPGSRGSQGASGTRGSRNPQGSSASRSGQDYQGSHGSPGAFVPPGSGSLPKAQEVPPVNAAAPVSEQPAEGPGQRSRRRRRRRGRRGAGAATAIMGTQTDPNRDPGESGTQPDGTDPTAGDDAEDASAFEVAVDNSAGTDPAPAASSDHGPSSSSDPDGEQ